MNPLSNRQCLDSIAHKYDISYILAAKSVVSGVAISHVYRWLSTLKENGSIDSPVQGDFFKYMVNKEGMVTGVFSGFIDPLSKEMESLLSN